MEYHIDMDGGGKERGRVVREISVGYQYDLFTHLSELLGVSQVRLKELLRLSGGGLQRRRAKGRFEPHESDAIARYQRLFKLATRATGTPDSARQWLQSPQFGLGGATPLDYANTEAGGRQVEALLLGSIEGMPV